MDPLSPIGKDLEKSMVAECQICVWASNYFSSDTAPMNKKTDVPADQAATISNHQRTSWRGLIGDFGGRLDGVVN